MMKKLFVHILLIVFVLNLAVISFADGKKTNSMIIDRKFQLATQLGVFDNLQKFDPNVAMTGSDFAIIMSNILKTDATGLYDNITTKDRVTCVEVVRVLINLLGYDVLANVNGGYPVGYLTQALKLKLLTGVKLDGVGQALSYNDLATILCNALDVEILNPVIVGDNHTYQNIKGITFLTKIMGIKKVSGQVTDNNITGINNENGVGSNIKINGELFFTTDKTKYAQQMIGQYIDAYYEYSYINSEDTNNTLICAVLNDKYDTLTIDARNILSYSESRLRYTLDNSNNQISTSINKDALVIFNGVVMKSYNSQTFDFSYGSVELIEGPSGGYGTVIITNYMDFVVSGIDKVNSIIYNKILDNNPLTLDTSLEFDINHLNSTYIKMSDGTPAKFSDIKVGDVLSVAKSGKYVEVIISRNQVKGFKVTEKQVDSDVITLLSDDKSYKISQYFANSSQFITLSPGDVVTISTNYYGDASLVTFDTKSGSSSGYFVRTFLSNDLSKVLSVKIFRRDGVMVALKCAKKIDIMDSNGVNSQYDSIKAEQLLRNFTGVVTYTLNKDGDISTLDLPLQHYDANNPNKLYKVAIDPTANYTYKSNIKTMGGQFYFASDVVIYYIPVDTNKDDEYMIKPLSTWETNFNPAFEAYSIDEDSVILNNVVLKGQVREIQPKDFVIAVLSISDVLTDVGITVRRVIGMENGTKVVLDSDTGAFEKAYDIPTKSLHTVQKGDVIRYSKMPGNGMVDKVQIIFSSRTINPAFPFGEKGSLVGSSGIYSPNSNDGNPFGADPDYALLAGAQKFNSAAFRVFYGWVYKKNGSVVTITTQDLTTGLYQGQTGPYLVESYNVTPFGKFTVMNLGGSNITAKQGTLDDIYSYKDSGASCSRFIGITFYGEIGQMFVINGSSN